MLAHLKPDKRFIAPDGHSLIEVIGNVATQSPEYSVAKIVAPIGSEGVVRQNAFDEIMIFIEGTGTIEIDGVRSSVSPNDVCLLPRGARYRLINDGCQSLIFWAVCAPAFKPELAQLL